MYRKTPLLTLALLALGAPALASDIDEVATFDLSTSIEAPKADGEQLQNRSRNSNSKAGARKNTQSGRGQSASNHSNASNHPNTSNAPRGAYNRGGPPPRPSAGNGPGPTPRPMGPPRPSPYANNGNNHSPDHVIRNNGNTIVRNNGNTIVRHNNSTVVNHNGNTLAHRPGNTVVNHGHTVRPGPTVIDRPAVVTHPVVGHRPVVVGPRVHTVRYTHVRPYHGIFVYGPRPVTHVQYVDAGPGPVEVQQQDLPRRAIDRTNSIGLGVKAGSMVSSTSNGQVYGDPGFGLTGRYRPAESVGLELGVGHHGSAVVDPLGKRSQTQVDGSVELFAFPWTRVSPYVLGGVTWNSANFADEVWTGDGYEIATNTDSQFGLHGGLGIEFALGNNFALDLEGRYVGWLDERVDGEAPGAIQANAGLQFYFK